MRRVVISGKVSLHEPTTSLPPIITYHIYELWYLWHKTYSLKQVCEKETSLEWLEKWQDKIQRDDKKVGSKRDFSLFEKKKNCLVKKKNEIIENIVGINLLLYSYLNKKYNKLYFY